MAWAAGLEISIENAAAAGSHSAFTIATDAGLEINPVASNAEHKIGVIANGPHNPPITYPTQAETLAQQDA